MKIGVVILSRYNSSRLPGKALKKIDNKPVLAYIVERIEKVFDRENIVIATSDEITDEPIAEYALKEGVKCFRGSLNNVSERFYKGAITNSFDYAIRINGDNIFVDTDLLFELTKIAKLNRYDFISNVKGRTYPKGMSIEIVKTSYYGKLMAEINKSDRYKEHVTLYLYEQESRGKENYFYKYNTDIKNVEGMQLALDTEEDFHRTTHIIESFSKPHFEYNLKEIYQILSKLNYV